MTLHLFCSRVALVLVTCILPFATLASDIIVGRTYSLAAFLIPVIVAFIHAVNFVSIAVQARGLIGPNGIMPVHQTLIEIEERFSYRDQRGLHTPVASRSMARLTVAIWRYILGEKNVVAAAWGGCSLAIGIAISCITASTVGLMTSPLAFVLLYLYWYAYKRVLGVFANLQWDMLLLESTILCVITTAAPTRIVQSAAIYLVQACVVRLHCGAGVAKLSGGQHWRNLTALSVHYETLPLPTPLAPWLHFLPSWFHRASTLAALVLETCTYMAMIPLPFARELAFLMVVAVQATIITSGCYGYFNALSASLGLSLLHDFSPIIRWLHAYIAPISTSSAEEHFALSLIDGVALAAFLPCALVYIVRASHYAEPFCGGGFFPECTEKWLRSASSTFFFANRYSLFSNMTVPRYEIVIEKTTDGVIWTECDFKYKPGLIETGIKIVPPMHLPRLDWRLWILAQQGAIGNRHALAPDWFNSLLLGLVEGRMDILSLFHPFVSLDLEHSIPIHAVRGRRYLYRYSKDRTASMSPWVRALPEGALTSFYGRKVEHPDKS